MWVLIVIRLMASQGDFVVMQTFTREATCQIAEAIIQQEAKKNNTQVRTTCLPE
jgi:hypothetical protein